MKHHQKRSNDAFTIGFEKAMNNPQTSPLTNPIVFHEIVNASGLTAIEAIRHIGKTSKQIQKEERNKSVGAP
jgi:hypothetical protein